MALVDNGPRLQEPFLEQPIIMMGKFVPLEVRQGFVKKVYAILCAQFVLTAAIAAQIQTLPQVWLEGNTWSLISSVAMCCSAVVITCCSSQLRIFPNNYLLLLLFTCSTGISVGYTASAYTTPSVVYAVVVTALVFLWVSIYAWTSSSDFTGGGPYLFTFLVTLLTFGISLIVLHMFGIHIPFLEMVYSSLGVLLFTFYIIYDTQLILGEWGGHSKQFSVDDYVFAAVNLYLDLINFFLEILQLLGEKK